MRIALFHSDDPNDVADAVALGRSLRRHGHDVLDLVRPGVLSAFRACGSEQVRVCDSRASDERFGGAVAAFAPDAFAVLASGAWPHIGELSDLHGARSLLEGERSWASHKARCEGVERALLGTVGSARNREADEQREMLEAEAAALDAACSEAVTRIAMGIESARSLREASRLILVLQHAIEAQAIDAADLQTQLDARAATIRDRDAQIAQLRARLSELGSELDRLHRVGADLTLAHKEIARLRDLIRVLEDGGVAVSPEEHAALKSRLATAEAEGARVAEIGAELERMHRVADHAHSLAAAREAELAAARAQIEELREQARGLHTLGAELHRVHGVAGELRAQLQIQSARVGEALEEVQRARRELREADASTAAARAAALVDSARAARIAEELARMQQAVIQSQARAETLRNDVSRARTDRDALDAVVIARDAEIARLVKETADARREAAAAVGARDRERARADALAAENVTLRQRLGELLASRWRKIGQRFGVAMTMPWEREIREIKPSDSRAGITGPGSREPGRNGRGGV
ncbi:MAG: hypothetical protein KIT19_08565 [Phycisphaeraceae bacterium]|nr:hypothetical protein [Phycisphaeraceae bacterium]